MAKDDEWKKLVGVTGDDEYARGLIEPATGLEGQPCGMCQSHDAPGEKVVRLFISHGAKVRPDGMIEAPTKGRPGSSGKPLVLDPKNMGYCRRDGIPTDIMASCENWKLKSKPEHFRVAR